MRRALFLALGLLACCPRQVLKPTPAKACVVPPAPAWRPVALAPCPGWGACLSVSDAQVLATDIVELRAWTRVVVACEPVGPGERARVAPASR